MNWAALGIVIIAAFLATTVSVLLVYAVMRFLLPALGAFAGAVVILVVTALLDIRYLVCISIAFLTAAHFAGGDWVIGSSIVSFYLFSLSLLFSLVFSAQALGFDIFKRIEQDFMRSGLDQDAKDLAIGWVHNLRFTVGLLGFLGALLSYSFIILLFSTDEWVLRFGFSNYVSFSFACAFDQLIEASPFTVFSESRFEKFLERSSPFIQSVTLLYGIAVWSTLVGVLVQASRIVRKQVG